MRPVPRTQRLTRRYCNNAQKHCHYVRKYVHGTLKSSRYPPVPQNNRDGRSDGRWVRDAMKVHIKSIFKTSWIATRVISTVQNV